MANRRCNCCKPTCFTCRRRLVNERYRKSHPPRPQHKNRSPDVSDDELDRRALAIMERESYGPAPL